MLDHLCIVTLGGLVMWETPSADEGKHRGTINTAVQDGILAAHAGKDSLTVDGYKVRWEMGGDARFYVIGVLHSFAQLRVLDTFMTDIARIFAEMFGLGAASPATPQKVFSTDFTPFGAAYKARFAELLDELKSADGGPSPSGGAYGQGGESGEDVSEADGADEPAPSSPTASMSASGTASASKGRGGLVTASGRVILRKGEASPPMATTAGKSAPPSATVRKGKPGRPQQQEVVDPNAHLGHEKPSEEDMKKFIENQKKTYIKTDASGRVAKIEERNWGEQAPRGKVSTWLRSYFGQRQLDEQDFGQVIPNLREKLISKNVAVAVADDVCKSVQTTLQNTKIGTFESLHTAIERSMIEALRRILRPKRDINILRDVESARARRRPFSIAVCGVNGVGKSTSLAKLCYWLQQNGNTVLMAAGDTFRHGAVEQLEVHGRCLGVDVFQLGYGTDPSAVAAAAIQQAAKTKTDVVMIDTAGRMQDHESRMRALAKLIHDNQPDLVLFVGEALVGNNGVDQLRKFNQCLHDYTPVGLRSRGIDGIILTKFDTIDDKVGAAVSMTYELGQPIVFVGVGQTYQDLKVIEADVVVSALMQ